LIPLCERTVIAGKYRLVRELASGGMGSVWVARHLALDEDVAVKFMSVALPDLADARARFAREARTAARLRGPHVVQVLDHGVDGELPYLVMELLRGEHLGERLRREGRLSLDAAASLAEQIGKALARAHRAGVVHRDLKPANVFLAQDDDGEVVKVLDFGIAKELDGAPADATHADVLMGSPQYMSPEQARGARDLDHRADLWSLGAILFRALTGVPAFEGTSAVDVIVRICTGPTPLPSRVVSGLPPELDAFFRKALDREPSRRFATAREMTEAFSGLVARTADPDPGAAPSGRDSVPTRITERRARATTQPPSAGAPGAAEPDDIDAFVDRAFVALLGPRADDGAPVTTRRPPPLHLRPPDAPSPLLRRLGVAEEPVRRPAQPPMRSSLMLHLSGLGGGAEREVAASSGQRLLPRGSVATLIDEGFSALGRGEKDTARRVWKEALGLDPSNRALELNLRRLDAMGATRD
jgi:serine/threonine-protein kinase